MSVGKPESEAEAKAAEDRAESSAVEAAPAKRARFDRCFTGMDIKLGKGPLKDMDPDKLKREIRRWAKAVVAYARQLSFKSSSRRGSQRGSEESPKEAEK